MYCFKILATTWTGDPASVLALDKVLQRSCSAAEVFLLTLSNKILCALPSLQVIFVSDTKGRKRPRGGWFATSWEWGHLRWRSEGAVVYGQTLTLFQVYFKKKVVIKTIEATWVCCDETLFLLFVLVLESFECGSSKVERGHRPSAAHTSLGRWFGCPTRRNNGIIETFNYILRL